MVKTLEGDRYALCEKHVIVPFCCSYQVYRYLAGCFGLISCRHYLGEKSFFSVEELAAHMQALSNQSFDSFQVFAHQLIQDTRTLDAQFEIWLEAIGHQQALEAWRQILTQ